MKKHIVTDAERKQKAKARNQRRNLQRKINAKMKREAKRAGKRHSAHVMDANRKPTVKEAS